jgi:hypothetical protein
MLELHHPGFSCPLCRTFADLEADVEVDPDELEHVVDDLPEDIIELVNQQHLKNGAVDSPIEVDAALSPFVPPSDAHAAHEAATRPADDAIHIDSDDMQDVGHSVPTGSNAMDTTMSTSVRQGRRPPPQPLSSTNPFRNAMTSRQASQNSAHLLDQEDAQVEDVLGPDIIEDDDDDHATHDQSVVVPGAYVSGQGNRMRSDTVHADNAVEPQTAVYASVSRLGPSASNSHIMNYTYNGSRSGPLRIDSGRRRLSMSDSDARDFAEA